MSGCNGQSEKKSTLNPGDKKNALSDTLNKPDVRVKVNKTYDDKGHIVSYDSTYTYGFSKIGSDSIFNHFKLYFGKSSPELFEKYNNRIFFNDSLFKYDFFNDNFFEERFQLNQDLFGNFYHQLDSLKSSFLQENYLHNQKKRNVK